MATTDIKPALGSAARPAAASSSTVHRIRVYDHVVLILGVLLMMGPMLTVMGCAMTVIQTLTAMVLLAPLT